MDAVGTVRPCPTDLAAICAYKDAIVYGGRRNERTKDASVLKPITRR
jgi:hypothetical protein